MNMVPVLSRTPGPWALRMWFLTAIFTPMTFGCLNRPDLTSDTTVAEVPKSPPAARVNGEEISQALFDREYRQTLARYERVQSEVNEDLKRRLRTNVIHKLINQKLMAQKAKALGVEPPTEQLWLEHKTRYGTEEAFAAFLERAGTTAEDFRRSFVHNQLKEGVFNQLREGVNITGEEIRAFFDHNEERFQTPEQIRARHILIRIPKTASKTVIQEKKALAVRVRKLALKPGTDFAVLASKYSEDHTKNQGGDLGYFPKGRMVKDFENAVWPLKVGRISKVIRTPFGFHIIKKTDQKPASHKNFQEVSEQIEQGLRAEKQIQQIRSSLAAWEQAATIEILVDIQTSTQPSPGTSPIPGLTSPIPTSTNSTASH